MLQRYILIIFIALSGSVFAQINTGSQVWLDYNYKEFIKPNLALGGDAGFRADIIDGDWYAAYIRPRVTYRANQTFAFVGGLALFHNWNSPSVDATEFRVEQQVTVKWPNYKKIHFENRLRIEERYFHYAKLSEGSSSERWSGRLRYRLMVKSDYFNVSEKIGNVYALIAAETFVPLQADNSQSFLIRERLVLGFGQLLPKGRRYEVDFMWQGPLNAKSDDAKTNLWMLRLRYYLQKNNFD